MRLARKFFIQNYSAEMLCAFLALASSIFLSSCGTRKNAVSGTIEVDEAHVGPRSSGRVEKIFVQEGDRLHQGQIIAQLEASELRARHDLAGAQSTPPFTTPMRRRRSWNFFALTQNGSRIY